MDTLSDVDGCPRTGAVGDRHIHGQGTPAQAWRTWEGLGLLPTLSLDAIAPPMARVVVVAPHPDDEVLGCGGALSMFVRARHEVLVLGVTEGEGSYPGSLRWTPAQLGRRRRDERQIGLGRLGVDMPPQSLGIADGRVAESEDALSSRLREMLRPNDVVITTWRHDGHPDHEATGKAAWRAASWRGCRCWEVPVWMWHWAETDDARVPWHLMGRLELDADATSCKRLAIAAHVSQLEPIAEEHRDPVLPSWALARLLRPFEVFLPSEALS